MKAVVLGLVAAVGIATATIAALGGNGDPFPMTRQPAPVVSAPSGAGLIALSSPIDDRFSQLTVIDPVRQAVAVYHIERSTGTIELRCVRNIHWDLQMAHFNGQPPLPQEIRSLVEMNR